MLARKDLGGNAIWGVVVLVLVTCLFYEWIRPLIYLTDTYTLWPFVLFFFTVMLMQWLASPWWIRLPVYLIITPLIIYRLYFKVFDFFSLHWLKYMYDLIQRSIDLLLARDFIGHPAEVATLLFLLVIGLAAVNIYNLVILRQRALFFMLLTAVYVAILDTFTPYSGMSAIFRALFFGLALLAIMQILRVLKHDDRSIDRYTGVKQFPITWLTVTIIIILSTTSFAFIAPKAAPSWPDPVSFLQGYSEYGIGPGGPGIRKIGYGDNDSRLGGPFEADDTPVFTALSRQRVYWRGESRDVYTGHGWESSDESKYFMPRTPEDGFVIPLQMYESGTPTEELSVQIEFESLRYHQVFYPGQPEQVSFPFQQVPYTSLNSTTGKIEAWQTHTGLHQVLSGYNIAAQAPVYSTKALLESSMADVPAQIRERYTQLPNDLPERVHELAQEIAEGAQTDYEIVRRIERYFRQNGYEYETSDVPVPRQDQDYVDQFLFETMRGYCDNFSSSMAVMLRTLGIPTRWVKGFTFGDMLHTRDGIYTATVTNNNAHSWVEVYFPEVGWVTFEPTRSFSNPYRFERDDLERSENNANNDLDFDPLEELLEDLEEDFAEDRENELPVVGAPAGEQPLQDRISFRVAVGLVLLLIALAVFAGLNRRRLLLVWALYRYKQGNSSQGVMMVYEWLIAYFGRFVEQRKPNQTMREYVELLIEKTEATDEVQVKYHVSTKAFEELRYNRQENQQGMVEKAFNSWRDLIKRLQQ